MIKHWLTSAISLFQNRNFTSIEHLCLKTFPLLHLSLFLSSAFLLDFENIIYGLIEELIKLRTSHNSDCYVVFLDCGTAKLIFRIYMSMEDLKGHYIYRQNSRCSVKVQEFNIRARSVPGSSMAGVRLVFLFLPPQHCFPLRS